MSPLSTYREAQILLAILGPDPDAERHMRELEEAIGMFCMIDGCERPSRSNRMCEAHARKHYRALANQAHLINRKAKAA